MDPTEEAKVTTVTTLTLHHYDDHNDVDHLHVDEIVWRCQSCCKRRRRRTLWNDARRKRKKKRRRRNEKTYSKIPSLLNVYVPLVNLCQHFPNVHVLQQ